jgi:hypothetical protein
MNEFTLDFEILAQPDDITCGPTCLHALYRFYGRTVPLDEVIDRVKSFEEGGTLAVQLGIDALKRGFSATIYTYNLLVFDPTWADLPPGLISQKLIEQQAVKDDAKLSFATDAYLQFLALGGKLRFEDLTPSLIRRYVKRGVPVLTGLSSTYLYQAVRERPDDNEDDDIGGYPCGHFVVIYGYNMERRTVMVADPLQDNPNEWGHRYEVDLARLVCSILLGVLTYDDNLLIVETKRERKGRS